MPAGPDRIREVQQQAAKLPTSHAGIALLSLASRQLTAHGHRQSAEGLLEAGLEQFRGQPGRESLVNELASQSHRVPPPPILPPRVFSFRPPPRTAASVVDKPTHSGNGNRAQDRGGADHPGVNPWNNAEWTAANQKWEREKKQRMQKFWNEYNKAPVKGRSKMSSGFVHPRPR